MKENPAHRPRAAGAEPTLGPITPDQPALVLFVLDRSVDDPFSGNMKNACVRLQQHLGVTFRGCMTQLGEIEIGFEAWAHVPTNPFFAPVADVTHLEQ